MRFGQTAAEAAAAPPRSTGGGGFMKYPKEGQNILRILDEPDKWIYYWEHYNPSGFSFPCTGDRDTCPGCTSEVQKMKKASYKVAFNCYDGQYTNVWKFPNQAVGEKLKARYERLGTLTDRDYMITQTKSGGGTEYDVEGLDKEPLTEAQWEELRKHMNEVEPMLAQAYEDSWGDSKLTTNVKTQSPTQTQAQLEGESRARRTPIQRDEPKDEPKLYKESELRAMDVWDLVALCKQEGLPEIPAGKDTTDEIVNWMLELPPF